MPLMVGAEAAGKPLKTARPDRVADAALNGFVGDLLKAVIGAQFHSGCDGEREVALLMLTRERRIDMQDFTVERQIVTVARQR